MEEDALFYVGQKAFIRKGDDILVLSDPIEGLDYPGGKIQEQETDLVSSLQREVREETSLEIQVGRPFATWTNVFPSQHRLAGQKVFSVGYMCEYVSGEITLSDEHDKFRWVNKDNFNQVDDGTSYFDTLQTYFNSL
jgi:8-oxo-dGTP diphosphatase